MKSIEFKKPKFAAAMNQKDGFGGVIENEILARFSETRTKINNLQAASPFIACLFYWQGF